MITPGPLDILFLVLLLQLKHAVVDGPLQTRWMLRGKGQYGAAPGLAHAGVHAAASLAILLAFGVGVQLAVLLAVADGFIHYHADWVKDWLVRRNGWTATDSRFWWSLAADQLVHHLTYLAMAALVVLWMGVRA